MTRLVTCQACRTFEEVPDYEGDNPVDPLMEQVVFKHNERDPMAHGGRDTNQPHNASPMRIMKVEDAEWNNPENDFENRRKIMEIIRDENKKVGLDAWAYEAMNTFSEDALKCYSAHNRPEAGCIDFWDDSKRLGRPTAEGRAAVADMDYYKLGKRDPHLCQFCPVFSFVQSTINMRNSG